MGKDKEKYEIFSVIRKNCVNAAIVKGSLKLATVQRKNMFQLAYYNILKIRIKWACNKLAKHFIFSFLRNQLNGHKCFSLTLYLFIYF